MCGIAGFFSATTFNYNAKNILNHMIESIKHRGPDKNGIWLSPNHNIALAHSRLSILDLSDNASQPMRSNSGRYTIVFNGEIYNYKFLKKELAKNGVHIHTSSDTKVLIQLFDYLGMEQTLKKITGMFAIAVWDNKEHALYIARDRIGEKPLYYTLIDNTLIFSSELKSIKNHPKSNLEINQDSLALLLKYNYIPAPFSIYKNTYKLPPAHYIKICKKSNILSLSPPICYWDLPKLAENSTNNKLFLSDSNITDELEKKLKSIISDQMVSDVPLGAFLSGGIDSSLIVSLMQSMSHNPIETFSIGFTDSFYNEAPFAKEIARHLGTNHNELYLNAHDAMNVIPNLSSIYDEPFADSSQIPTFIVSKLAREKVSVSLSGDGADELFGGYDRYPIGVNLWNKITRIPKPIRHSAIKIIKSVDLTTWNRIFEIIPNIIKSKSPGYTLYRISDVLKSNSFYSLYTNLLAYWPNPENIVLDSKPVHLFADTQSQRFFLNSLEEEMMLLDLLIYQPDDILVKLDRAAMSNSLETRVPFLDHNLIEYAFKIPIRLKIRNGQGKWILKQILKKYVPESLFERPKMGFGIPLGNWLRNELREWAEDLLDPVKMDKEGFFNSKPIQNIWKLHLENKADYQTYLWSILMFQSWLRNN